MQNFLTFPTFFLYFLHFSCVLNTLFCACTCLFSRIEQSGSLKAKKPSLLLNHFFLCLLWIIRAPQTSLLCLSPFPGDFPLVRLKTFFFIVTGFWLKRPKTVVFLLLCCRAQLPHFVRACSVIKASKLDFTGKLL